MYYTKYRPQKFSEMSGPNDIIESLLKQIKTKKTAHAYLFVGPRGIGKTTAARILAKALNCSNLDSNGDPCAQCESCLAISNSSYLDLIEIDAASNRGIDDIRSLKEKIKLAPALGDHKVYIIDEVHMLTTEAFNALLKTLEEPPKHVTFILCTTELHKVPDTIKSRCQIYNFKRASMAKLTKKLKEIAKKEEADLTEQQLKQIASASNGGFRDAENLLQQIIEGELSTDSLSILSNTEAFYNFTNILIQKDCEQLLYEINKVVNDGTDLYVWVGELLNYLRDLMFIKANAHEKLLDITDEFFGLMQDQAKNISDTFILETLEALIKAQNEVKNSFIAQLPLEIALVKLCTFPRVTKELSVTEITPNPSDNLDNTDIIPKVKFKKEVTIENSSGGSVEHSVEIELVKNSWNEVLKKAQEVNHGIYGLLRIAIPNRVEGDKLILEVPFDFHKERIEATKNILLVEDCLKTVFETKLLVGCEVKKRERKKKGKESGKLTDINVMVPSNAGTDPDSLLDVFDGSLPF